MSNSEHYIEKENKRLLVGIEGMLANAAFRIQELHESASQVTVGGVKEVSLPHAIRTETNLDPNDMTPDIPLDSDDTDDPFEGSDDLYGKLLDVNNDIDYSDAVIDDDDDDDGDSYRYIHPSS